MTANFNTRTGILLACLAVMTAASLARIPGRIDPPELLLQESSSSAESRALEYLSREVPRWHRENRCFSCHNNGDAARALYQAIGLSEPVSAQDLADTTRWLARPEAWDHNKGDPAFSDKGLARLQFASALVDGFDAKLVTDRAPLLRAAGLVAEHQHKDGSWRIDTAGTLGSPATYGSCLATAIGRRVLRASGSPSFHEAIALADRWLSTVPVQNVMDASAVLIGLDGRTDETAHLQQHRCLDIVRRGQTRDGGWGPYLHSPPEAFDTAMALLALSRHRNERDVPASIRRGREFLIRTQEKDGSWRESTRPPGAESYAQRLSTTGWAAQALLATRHR